VDRRYRPDFVDGRPVRTRLFELCRELGQLARQYGAWVRLHYVYPYPAVDDVLPLMAEGLILPYLDVPLQHAHPRILKLMKRPASGERNIERIQAWRKVCPELTIRSTFIAGFPGETEEEFQYLLDFLEEAQLDRVGCFAYSPVEGAAANDLPDPLLHGADLGCGDLDKRLIGRDYIVQLRDVDEVIPADEGHLLVHLSDDDRGDLGSTLGIVAGDPKGAVSLLIRRADLYNGYVYGEVPRAQ